MQWDGLSAAIREKSIEHDQSSRIKRIWRASVPRARNYQFPKELLTHSEEASDGCGSEPDDGVHSDTGGGSVKGNRSPVLNCGTKELPGAGGPELLVPVRPPVLKSST